MSFESQYNCTTKMLLQIKKLKRYRKRPTFCFTKSPSGQWFV